MADIECVFDSINSVGSIFISNLVAASNIEILKKNKIRAIVSIARSGFVKHKRQQIPYYLYIPAEDHEEYRIIEHFQETFQFIDKARKQTNVLVHCVAGVSRSVTIVLAYLLKKYKYPVNHIFNMIKRKRRKINPNKGFLQQLESYSMTLGIKQQSIINQTIKFRQSSASKFKKQLMAAYEQNPSKHNRTQSKLSQKSQSKDISYKIPQNFQNQQRNNIYTSKKLKKAFSFNQNTPFQFGYEDDQPLDLPQPLQLKKITSLPQSLPQQLPLQSARKSSKIQQKINKIRQKMIRSNSLSKRTTQSAIYHNRQSISLNKLNQDHQSNNNQQNSIKCLRTTTTFTDSLSLNRDRMLQQTKNCSIALQLALQPIEMQVNQPLQGFKLSANPNDRYKHIKKGARVYF